MAHETRPRRTAALAALALALACVGAASAAQTGNAPGCKVYISGCAKCTGGKCSKCVKNPDPNDAVYRLVGGLCLGDYSAPGTCARAGGGACAAHEAGGRVGRGMPGALPHRPFFTPRVQVSSAARARCW